MEDTVARQRRQQTMSLTRRCHECEEEALGRCPDCHQGFCQEHFPKQQHSPCAEEQMRLAPIQVCYVCGTPAYPDQWSISPTSHFVDQYRCSGCHRYICDELHTRHKDDEVVIIREGLRGHRYQYTTRYCDLCSPLRRLGGLKGLARWLAGAGTVAAVVFFYLHH